MHSKWLLILLFLLIGGVTMGFFTFSKKESSANWPDHQKTKALLDFQAGSLNGVRLGAPGESIRVLGKPSNADPVQTGDYYYFVSGIEFEDIDSEVSVFRCIFYDRWRQGHLPSNLTLKSENKTMEINKDTNVEGITSFIGEPSDIETKEEISIYYYEFERHYYEFDFSKDGKIVCIHAYLKEPKK